MNTISVAYLQQHLSDVLDTKYGVDIHRRITFAQASMVVMWAVNGRAVQPFRLANRALQEMAGEGAELGPLQAVRVKVSHVDFIAFAREYRGGGDHDGH